MKSVKTLQLIYLTAAICLAFFASSCNTQQDVFTDAQQSIERLDMVIEGNEQEYIYIQEESGSKNLVNYQFYGAGAHQFDIRLNLDDERSLVIKLVNENATDLWEIANGYSMFTTQDLDDKQQYVTVDLVDGSEVAAFQSNIGDVFPRGTSLNVFNILDYNPANNELFCRIIDMELMSTTDQEVITINGTFRASVHFMN